MFVYRRDILRVYRDPEYTAPAGKNWWQHARQRMDILPIVSVFLENPTVEWIDVNVSEVEPLMQWCKSITGWSDGPKYNSTPLYLAFVEHGSNPETARILEDDISLYHPGDEDDFFWKGLEEAANLAFQLYCGSENLPDDDDRRKTFMTGYRTGRIDAWVVFTGHARTKN